MLIGVGVSCHIPYFIVSCLFVKAEADRLPRLGKRRLIFLLPFTCNSTCFLLGGVSSSFWCLG